MATHQHGRHAPEDKVEEVCRAPVKGRPLEHHTVLVQRHNLLWVRGMRSLSTDCLLQANVCLALTSVDMLMPPMTKKLVNRRQI